jgi:hypothetical protein
MISLYANGFHDSRQVEHGGFIQLCPVFQIAGLTAMSALYDFAREL